MSTFIIGVFNQMTCLIYVIVELNGQYRLYNNYYSYSHYDYYDYIIIIIIMAFKSYCEPVEIINTMRLEGIIKTTWAVIL